MSESGDVATIEQPLEPDTPEPTETDAALWPPRDDRDVLDAFARTWWQSLTDPTRFFSALPGTRDALLYFLPVGIIGAAIHLFWRSLALTIGGFELGERFGIESGWTPVVEFLFSPVLLLLALAFCAFVVHAMLWFFRGTRGGPITTLRVLAFAYGPVLLGIIPGLGDVVGFIWMHVLAIIGLRVAHNTRWWKAVAAVLVPIFVLGAIAIFVMAVGFAIGTIGKMPVR
jgi:hypothetical protein